MKGHKGKVNCLLYPHSQSKFYHSEYLLSGSSDFSVKLWDLYSGVLVHTFAVHGGEVKNIVSCPPGINVSIKFEFYVTTDVFSVCFVSSSLSISLVFKLACVPSLRTTRWPSCQRQSVSVSWLLPATPLPWTA